jgi:hypothetical protein
MASITWGRDIAETYDEVNAAKYDHSELDPMVEVLSALARGGPALEFAIGTGRVALPLVERGVDVHGLELSPHMVERLRAKPGGDDLPVTIGDMAATRVSRSGAFRMVYLVANTIMNVTTQDEQIAVFENAAPLDRGAGAAPAPLSAVPLRMALGAEADGDVGGSPARRTVGGLALFAVHLRQHHPDRRLRQGAVVS